MNSLTSKQRALIETLVEALRVIPGMEAIVLGGSHARGCARPDSDIDLGLYYSKADPIDVGALRRALDALPRCESRGVTEIGEWGPWVNGGAWLLVADQPVDLLYRSLESQNH